MTAASRTPVSPSLDDPALPEPHFTVPQIAARWQMAPNTVRELFFHEPGVLRWGRLLRNRKHKRHFLLRIPASVLKRVDERLRAPVPAHLYRRKAS